MTNMRETFRVAYAIVGIALFLYLMHIGYYIVKTISYKLFYQKLVQEEITQIVDSSCIKKTERRR